MIVDASVWVARFLDDDKHHDIAADCMTALLRRRIRLAIPLLAWSEVAGAIARRTGLAQNGHEAVAIIRGLRWIKSVLMDVSLANKASEIAASVKLRGADAAYVALAATYHEPLITLDAEMLQRAGDVVNVMTPEQWLQKG